MYLNKNEEDIILNGYVINKVNLGNGITLSKGNSQEKIESLLGKPSKIREEKYTIIPHMDFGILTHSLHDYDDLSISLIYYDFSHDLETISIKNPNIS